MKTLIKKTFRFFSNKVLYFVLGILISLSIVAVNAAWNSQVSSGQQLTDTLWNDLVAKIVEINNEIASLDSAWTLTGSKLSTDYNVGIGTAGSDVKLTVAGNFTPGSTNSQIMIIGATNPDNYLSIGYDTTNNQGRIQAKTEGVSVRELLLNPEGGNVNVGWSLTIKDTNIRSVNNNYAHINIGSNAGILSYGSVTDGNALYVAENAYIDASGTWKRKSNLTTADEAGKFEMGDGQFSFERAVADTGNTNITWLPVLKTDADGDIGIGTTPDSTKLAIVGAENTDYLQSLYILNTNQNTLTLRHYGAGNDLNDWNIFDVYAGEQKIGFRINYDNTKFLGMDDDGDVGIGTMNPNSRLEVHSRGTETEPFKVFHSDGSLAFYINEDNSGETHVYIRDAAGNPKIGLRGNGDTYFNGGNVGIGTPSPNAKLEVNGNIKATGGLDPNYDSGWTSVNLNTNYTFTHNFGQRVRDVRIWVAQNDDGSGWSFIANGLIYATGASYTVTGVAVAQNNLNDIKVRVAEMLGYSYDGSSANWRSSGYIRVLAWK